MFVYIVFVEYKAWDLSCVIILWQKNS